MGLGVFFDGFARMSEMLGAARAAEDAGAQSLWFAQHMGYREAFMCAATAAMTTSKVMVAPVSISPYLWPPLPVAMSIASLNELAPGRAIVVVAVGNRLNLAQSGIEPVKPIRVMREYVAALRALLAGEAVHLEGEINTLRGGHLNIENAATVPIMVASTGPQMLALAGEIGDGVVLSTGLTLPMTRQCLDHAAAGAKRKGRDPSAVRSVGFINLAVSEDGKTARAAVRRKLAYLFRSQGHADNIKSSGLSVDHEAIIAAVARRDLDAATALLPDEAADAFGVAGTPRACRDRLRDYLSAGLDDPIVEMTAENPEAQQLALEVVREVTGNSA